MHAPKAVHPLLLEPTYWRNRLQALGLGRPGLNEAPRTDLSGRGREVTEYRVATHDRKRIWGLYSRPLWVAGERPAVVRMVGPAQAPCLCPDTLSEGHAEFVFQEPAGRKLEDRVLDVLAIARLVIATDGIDPRRIRFAGLPGQRTPDEVLIAQQLQAGKYV